MTSITEVTNLPPVTSTKAYAIRTKLQLSLDHAAPLGMLPSIPEPARAFFSSVSNPAEILSSKLVSKVEGVDVIEGGYNFVHILNLDIGEFHPPFPFVLRVPIDPDAISRSQTCNAVGCMLYCQRHPALNIPTPAIYAYSCVYGSEFIAMEYVDGDTLSKVWLDLSEEDQQRLIHRIVEVMQTMRTKTSFSMIGGISPDGSACPLVDGVNARDGPGMGLAESFGLYNAGPYKSVREYFLSAFDRQFHYLDQILHKGTLSAYEERFKEEMSFLRYSTLEDIFERIKRRRDKFTAHPYDTEHPYVLRHGDFHARNIIVSRSSPRRILAIVDWDFGGSHALPLADDYVQLGEPRSDLNTNEFVRQADQLRCSEAQLGRLIGSPEDDGLKTWIVSMKLPFFDYPSDKIVPGQKGQ